MPAAKDICCTRRTKLAQRNGTRNGQADHAHWCDNVVPSDFPSASCTKDITSSSRGIIRRQCGVRTPCVSVWARRLLQDIITWYLLGITQFESIAQSVLRAGLSGDRIPVGARYSAPVQTGLGVHPAPCAIGTEFFPEAKRPGRWPTTPSSVEVKERVGLYLDSPCVPLWPVLGWSLLYPVPVSSGTTNAVTFVVVFHQSLHENDGTVRFYLILYHEMFPPHDLQFMFSNHPTIQHYINIIF